MISLVQKKAKEKQRKVSLKELHDKIQNLIFEDKIKKLQSNKKFLVDSKLAFKLHQESEDQFGVLHFTIDYLTRNIPDNFDYLTLEIYFIEKNENSINNVCEIMIFDENKNLVSSTQFFAHRKPSINSLYIVKYYFNNIDGEPVEKIMIFEK